ncbi:MAG: hypothetical protein CSA76_03840 [Spirochaetales bacterium]|nr:MAG: hypothetical protein CSA76_03840 [Spirochaetales bacterium]
MKNRMHKTGLVIVLFCLLPALVSLGAVDSMWGARLKLNLDLPEIYSSSIAMSTRNDARAWYRGSWSEQSNLEVELGMGFEYGFLFGMSNQMEFKWNGFSYNHFPILDKLNYYGKKGTVSYRAGRQVFRDPGGLVINSPFDGFDLKMTAGSSILRAGFGYTGLTFGNSAGYYMTNQDSSASVLSTGRLLEYVSWERPGLTEWMDLSVSLVSLWDVSSLEKQQDTQSRAFHPIYLTLSSRGFINRSFLYNAALAGQLGFYGNSRVLAGILSLGLSWLPDNSSRVGADIQIASGDTFNKRGSYLLARPSAGLLFQYIPVSPVSNRGYVVQFKSGNMTSLGLFYARKVRDTFSWEARTTTFLRTADGPVSTPLVKSFAGNENFLGQEFLASFMWRPRSDFGWDLRVGMLCTGKPIQLDTLLQQNYLGKVPLMFKAGSNWTWSF